MSYLFKLRCLSIGLICSIAVRAAIPQIINFSTQTYKGHSINYDFYQDEAGILYVGNAYGVLQFDGVNWRKTPLVDGKSALRITQAFENKIFISSSSEFGFLNKRINGEIYYQSLKALMPEKEIGEIEHLIFHNNILYYASQYGLYAYDGSIVHTLYASAKQGFIYDVELIDGELFCFAYNAKIYQIDGLSLIESTKNLPKNKVIIGKMDQYILTNESILFTDNHATIDFSEQKITCFSPLNHDQIAVGTQHGGLYILDSRGEILSHYNKNTGLKDDYIRRLFLDKNGDIWLAYNNGIGLIKWNAPITYLKSSSITGIEGMGLCAQVKSDTLYLGTTQGLFYLENWEHNLHKMIPFKRVKGLSGGVNDLSISNGHLIACYFSEVFEIKGDQSYLRSDGRWWGSWIWKQIDANTAIVGNYVGLSLFKYINHQWHFAHKIKGFEESSRVLEVDENGVIWVIQGNKGLYRVVLSAEQNIAVEVTNYAEKLNLQPDFFNDIFRFQNKIYMATYGGMFELVSDSLMPLKNFQVAPEKLHRVRKLNNNELYAIYNDQAHPMQQNNGVWEIYNAQISFLQHSLVGSAEHIKELKTNFYAIGTEEGFAFYNAQEQKIDFSGNCLIREIVVFDEEQDSLLFHEQPTQSFTLPYYFNNLRINFSIAIFGDGKQIVYETRLKRNNKIIYNWQGVKGNQFREFTNLKEGNYIFEVRALKGGFILGEKSMEFTISPPWYRTGWAFIFYTLLLILLFLWIKVLFKRQQKKLIEEKRKELEIKEKLHHAEKLEIDLKNKENELAYLALTSTQKKEILSRVAQNLEAIAKDLKDEDRYKINAVKRIVEGNLDDNSNWENFQVHFDQKNDNFFAKLKEIDPKITEAYLLFCSYVRMGKSNKEIADLLNISVAAIEKRKYRLKKKWDMDQEANFTDFLRAL